MLCGDLNDHRAKNSFASMGDKCMVMLYLQHRLRRLHHTLQHRSELGIKQKGRAEKVILINVLHNDPHSRSYSLLTLRASSCFEQFPLGCLRDTVEYDFAVTVDWVWQPVTAEKTPHAFDRYRGRCAQEDAHKALSKELPADVLSVWLDTWLNGTIAACPTRSLRIPFRHVQGLFAQ